MFDGLDWASFLLAMAAIELTPGPNMGWLAAHSAQNGRKAGFAAVAGVTLGLGVQLLAAATGVTALIAASPSVFQALRWAGIAFMLYLAWDAFRGGGAETSAKAQSGIWRGFVANLLNPKSLVFYVAVVGQFVRPDAGPAAWQILGLGLIHLGVALLVHSGIVLAGAHFGARIERWRKALAVRLGFALVLAAIAVWLAVSTVNPA